MKKKIGSFTAVIERDLSTGVFVGEIVELPGCFTQGKTVEEVTERLRELIPVFLEEGEATSEFIALQKIPLKV